MDATVDDRLRSVVLYGVAALALAVGGWWWRAAAPAPTAGPVGASTAAPSVGRSVSTELDRARALLTAAPGERLRVRVDAAGEMVRTEVDPATGMITDIEGDPTWLVFEGELPVFRETIWREQVTVVPGQQVVFDGSGSDPRQVLQYRCTRPGTLVVTVTGAELNGPSEIDCDGVTSSGVVFAHGRPFRVTLSAGGTRVIDVEAQLVTLPR
ncbi:hypothetical protein O7634_07465 [Micromonospora sp. WMMD1120]|uniref:hypothetical protein n=1 Tax=Micromonospora sp. WMMD1120 TaxID=3016106 RepID=UPI002416A7F9|nr:hypothetical protein [Micromonospora sp. WMMD1120]MDG4806593.1 hypothetical protein [Micromonospora sp. WMMD1120]